jgi:2-keto-4-pentenoate hydratase/2-oxohepta-3-ene-1,7-dioic acid hydratase in catechol pathway
MRLASVRHPTAGAVWGAVEGDALIPLSAEWADIRAALASDPHATRSAAAAESARLALDGCEWLPPIPSPGKILCVGLNYKKHVAEAQRELPQHPSLFPRFADSFVGHGAAVTRPWVSGKFDFEGELAVVIGRDGRHIPRERALGHVAGYTCLAENSVRDFQKHNAQVTPGKNFAGSGAMGPWLVTADEIPDPAALSLRTYLNGERVQDGRLADLIFPVPELIAYISIFTPLAPGDVIATGTPEGVGSSRKPPLFMRAGDVLEVDIPGVGRLRNPVVDEPRADDGEHRP